MKWLDALGVTSKHLPKNQRGLLVPLDEAVKIIRRSDFVRNLPRKKVYGTGNAHPDGYQLLLHSIIKQARRDDGDGFSFREWIFSDDFMLLLWLFGVSHSTVMDTIEVMYE